MAASLSAWRGCRQRQGHYGPESGNDGYDQHGPPLQERPPASQRAPGRQSLSLRHGLAGSCNGKGSKRSGQLRIRLQFFLYRGENVSLATGQTGHALSSPRDMFRAR